MKFSNICLHCGFQIEIGDDVEVHNNSLYHVSCVNALQETTYNFIPLLEEAILNFDEMNEFTEFNIDLEELSTFVEEIKNNKYVFILRGNFGGLAIHMCDTEDFSSLVEFLDERLNEGEPVYVIAVIENRRFVNWEELPRQFIIK